MHQEQLWHDTIEDALRSCVDVCGGFKKVGSALWPSLPVDQAGRRLAMSLDPERPEKLGLSELLMIIKMGRERGCHFPMSFVSRECGYQEPVPSDPQTAHELLQREFIRGVDQLTRVAARLERIEQAPRKTGRGS